MSDVVDNLPAIKNLVGNEIAIAKRIHDLAWQQFISEHKAGSRSDSRGMMLAEIGTTCKEILNLMDRIKIRLDLLDEIDPQYDPEAKEEELPLYVF